MRFHLNHHLEFDDLYSGRYKEVRASKRQGPKHNARLSTARGPARDRGCFSELPIYCEERAGKRNAIRIMIFMGYRESNI